LLQVDPKTFRRWLAKAQMTPQISRADDRVKYLTQEQVDELAKLHDRQVPETLPQQEATLAVGTYKLVLDQIDELRQAEAQTEEQVHALQKTATSLLEEAHQFRNEQDVQRTSLETLRVLTDHRFKETDQALKEQGRELRAQTEELRTDTRVQVEQVAKSVNTLSEQLEQQQERQTFQQQETEQTISNLEQQFKEKIEYLELALAKITQAYETEREARLALEQRVVTLQTERKSTSRTKNRESQGKSGCATHSEAGQRQPILG
jgi:regulator of replication initiation timing